MLFCFRYFLSLFKFVFSDG